MLYPEVIVLTYMRSFSWSQSFLSQYALSELRLAGLYALECVNYTTYYAHKKAISLALYSHMLCISSFKIVLFFNTRVFRCIVSAVDRINQVASYTHISLLWMCNNRQ